jgi:signal transduction histidine kinase
VSEVVDDDVLARVAYDRARVFSRLLVVAVAWYTVGGELVGIPTTRFSYTVDFAIAVMLAGIVVLTSLGKLADHGHLLLGSVWALTTVGTMQSLLTGHQPGLSLVVILQILGISVLLQTRFVVVSLAIVAAVYVPFLLVVQIPGWSAHLAGAGGAFVFAIVFHRVFRAAMLEAELRRRAQVDAASVLRRKLAEIESSRAAREALAQQLAATERIEATGTLAASFAHQMNNILTGITMTASLLARRGKPEHRADYDVLLAESQRGSDLTRALLAFSRRAALEREAQPFDDVVKTRCELIARMLPRTVQLELALAAPIDVECDVVQIGQLLMNLAMNAADAIDGKGEVVVETSVVLVDGERYVRLDVRDRGRGMDEATRARAFDPFFTTKPRGKGMGLPTAWGIVRAHDGTIAVDSLQGEGTTVTVQMPAVKGTMS